jgi:choline dehydrogenase
LGADIIDQTLHGSDGHVQVRYPEGTGELDQAWAPTLASLGLEAKYDPRKGDTLGGYALLKTMDKQARRSYAAPAYYLPNADRSNLTVITGAFVKKIEFEKKDGAVTATGAWYEIEGKEKFVSTRGDVILSAGTIQSPQILELSGIGERGRLEKLGIDVIVDNPNVGENLQVCLLRSNIQDTLANSIFRIIHFWASHRKHSTASQQEK